MLTSDYENEGEEWKQPPELPGEGGPRGLDLLCALPDTPALRVAIRRLHHHQQRLPLWPRPCKDCGESFQPLKRTGVVCAACRAARRVR